MPLHDLTARACRACAKFTQVSEQTTSISSRLTTCHSRARTIGLSVTFKDGVFFTSFVATWLYTFRVLPFFGNEAWKRDGASVYGAPTDRVKRDFI